ncbi:MAG: hypothetical protein AAGJ46_18555 [Planctomycetota bacterium]
MPVYLFSYEAENVGSSGGQRWLTEDHQRRLIDAAVDAQRGLRCRCFAAAAERGRFQVLVAWEDGRDARDLRRRIGRELEGAMRGEFGGAAWLSSVGSRTRLRNRPQFDHVIRRIADGAPLAWVAGRGFTLQPAPLAKAG